MKKIIGCVFVLVVVLVAAVTYVAYKAVLSPVVTNEHTVYVQILPEYDMKRVGEVLNSTADIATMTGFAPLMKHYKYDGRVKPGNYAIRPGDSMRDICLRLLSGHNLQHTQPMEAEIPVQVKNSSKSIKNNKQKCDI